MTSSSTAIILTQQRGRSSLRRYLLAYVIYDWSLRQFIFQSGNRLFSRRHQHQQEKLTRVRKSSWPVKICQQSKIRSWDQRDSRH